MQSIGPPPQSLTSSLNTFAIQACNKIGDIDPNAITKLNQLQAVPVKPLLDEYSAIFYPQNEAITDTPVLTWSECSGHGVWNSQFHYCVCVVG